MDIDEQPLHSPRYANAVAGPSTLPDLPPLILPSPGPPHPPPYFASTDDLLKRFQLLPAYDKYVRPFATPVVSGATDKGKGKEIPFRDVAASSPVAQTPAGANEGEDEDGAKGEKKYKNYKHLIKSVPGKHSMKKDDYLATLMQIPPKQKIKIEPFSQKTTREAFSVSLEGLKGWNMHALVAESSQAREDRKRRKELKKLAKAQGQANVQVTASAVAAGPNTPTTGVPTTPGIAPTSGGAVPTVVPQRTSTPRPGVPKPPPAHQQPSQPRGRTPVGIGTPQSVSTPAPQQATPPSSRPQADLAAAPPSRGVKRDREEGLQVNGNIIPPHTQEGVKFAKAGVSGVRPRPIKKARLDTTGQPFQQPTPHS